ncbi:ADP-ribosylglycohydrolase family protein [Sulfitobacter sp. R18_1]|uniref:ADP-ribosylglycohydrolase family protein n=1 Tax=Sulfitobacter sp. R18_1 TaxID=2821104 RepID=UPI001ADC6949|nr:ADP-ribosylglycohydrolase family protein [Sulfitobacter sp. R18_1]MBO9428797.1 ADP-ribosylglycohydrolase family protein [Sulfitobacter sp. R18_1]
MKDTYARRKEIRHNVLLATALGDSLGLPFENLSRSHVNRIFQKTAIKQIMLPSGEALLSDGTEHALLTARSLGEANDDPKQFERILGRQLKRWFMACPPGIGGATLRSCFKMACGVAPSSSGVKSAGNGPLMRVPVIAVKYREHPKKMREFIGVSTKITHTDPRAVVMALFLADLIVQACDGPLLWTQVKSTLDRALNDFACPQNHVAEMQSMMNAIDQHDPNTADPEDAMKSIGCRKGVSGYILHSAFAAAWFAVRANGDVREAIRLSIEAGGDTDSVAAVAAALTSCSPHAVMPNPLDTSYAGCIAGNGMLINHSVPLCNEEHLLRDLNAYPEPTVHDMFKDNMRAWRALLRHILWRRLF